MILEDVCRFQGLGRIQSVYGLISNEHKSGLILQAAVEQCNSILENARLSQKPRDSKYVCISPGQVNFNCPVHSLSGLIAGNDSFRESVGKNTSILLKIDVEGAEFMVLQGAEAFLKEFRPTIALSIHWYWLENFKTSREEILGFLMNLGYATKLIATDHEEHWWCEPSKV